VSVVVFEENELLTGKDGKPADKVMNHHKEFKGKGLLKVKI
jgi:hypothetical protein